MSQNEPELYDLTRRKVLGGLTAVGIASAGAGLGTSAYFSDQETYENNRLVAGSLDLKVDWEEHYSDGSDDESDSLDNNVLMSAPNDLADHTALPDPQNPLVWVHNDDLDQYMTNTAIEAYPDDGDNGRQSLHRYSEENYCDVLADTPEDLDPNQNDPARTLNDDTVDENGEPKPLVSLTDVKPGDFGELTLSLHLCDNPGYVWMNGELVSASENGLTEPERKDPDEEEGRVELLDQIQTLAWYDEDGDNVYEPGGVSGEADIALVLDDSGSMDDGALSDAQDAAIQLVDTVGSNAQISVIGFDTDPSMEQVLTTDKQDARDAVNGLDAGGRTNIEEAVDMAHEELDGHDINPNYSASGNDRDGADKIIVLLTDGTPNEGYESTDDSSPDHDDDEPSFSPAPYGDQEDNPADNADFLTEDPHDITMYTVGFGGVSSGDPEADLLEYMATDDGGSFIGAQEELFDIFSQIAQEIAGEKNFFQGSLRDLLSELSDGNGIPLDGNRTSNFDEVPGDGLNEEAPSDPASTARDCFVPSTNNYIGLAWWLPVDHGNEVQSDSVSFDLGFYTEQCRHNDGAGMAPERQYSSNELLNRQSGEQVSIADVEGASPIVATITDDDPVVFEIEPALPMDAGGDQNSNMGLAFDPEVDGGAWDFQLTWNHTDAFTYLENNPVTTEPSLANVSGVNASFDSDDDVFRVEIARSRLTAGGDDYRFAFQTIDDTSGTTPTRIDAELPSGFDFQDSSTWITDTLR